MTERGPLFWATPEHNLVANALGYGTHTRYMKKHSAPYFDYREDAPIALAICPADKYQPFPGKYNVLFTMWEFLDVPPSYIEGINKADALIVPCSFCKEIFSKHFPAKRIYVCHEGVDEKVFTFKERKFPDMAKGEKFRFLWLGAPNPRKGYPFLLEMVKVFEQVPTVEIYMKTTMPKLNWWKTIKNAWKKRKDIIRGDGTKRNSLIRMIRRIPKPYYNERVVVMGKHKNVFLDTRKLPTDELVALYHSAHGFVMPHLGEGWGLTLCEAMATGCPSISVAETGCRDFFDEKVGYTLKTDILKQDLREGYDLPEARAYVPNAKDLLDKMTQVMMNYPHSVKLGKKASDRIREKFTWDIAGKRLRGVIDQIIKDRGIECKISTPELATTSS